MATYVVHNQRVGAADKAAMDATDEDRREAATDRAEAQFDVGGADESPNIYPSYSGTVTLT